MNLIDKRKEAIQLLLGLLLVVFLAVMFILGIGRDGHKELWIAVGIAVITFLLFAEKRGATVFLAIMLIGTLVAREEFILEATSVLRGETLENIRNSRPPSIKSLELTSSEKKDRLAEILELIEKETGDSYPELAKEIENVWTKFSIQADAKKLPDTSKAWVEMLAVEGQTQDSNKSRFYRYFISKDLSPYIGWPTLKTAGYIKIGWDMKKNEFTFLTEKGRKLSEVLGFSPVEQIVPEVLMD